jgi:hypothetical protein
MDAEILVSVKGETRRMSVDLGSTVEKVLDQISAELGEPVNGLLMAGVSIPKEAIFADYFEPDIVYFAIQRTRSVFVSGLSNYDFVRELDRGDQVTDGLYKVRADGSFVRIRSWTCPARLEDVRRTAEISQHYSIRA